VILPSPGSAGRPAFDHFWVVTDDGCAVKATTPEDAARLVETTADHPVGRKLRVIVVTPAGQRDPVRGAILTGPAEMWSEVPEQLLAHVPLGREQSATVCVSPASRIRFVGEEFASVWVDVRDGLSELRIVAAPALGRTLRVRGSAGAPLTDAVANLGVTPEGGERGRVVAVARSSAKGELAFEKIPGDSRLSLVVNHPDHLPLVLDGRLADLPESVTLQTGAAVNGRVVNEKEEPLSGVTVTIEGWLASNSDALFQRSTSTDDEGVWRMGAVPSRVTVVAAKPGYAIRRDELVIEEGKLNVGTVVLSNGFNLTLRVRTDDRIPIADAMTRVDGRDGSTRSDAKGNALLRDLDASVPLVLRIGAEGFIERKLTVHPPLPRIVDVALTRAFIVTGAYRDKEHAPIADALLKVEAGSGYRDVRVDPTGVFRLELEPDVEYSLSLLSPSNGDLRLPPVRGVSGEQRDLGELTPQPGATITGRVISSVTGLPVLSASVWAPRPTPEGPVMAWVSGNVIRGVSDREGLFVLRGVPFAPLLLRVDAPSHARQFEGVSPEPLQSQIDLGDILVDQGAEIVVNVDGDSEGATARLDLRGEYLDLDILTAQVVEGRATFPAVTPGKIILTVLRERETICEQAIEAPATGSKSVTCSASSTTLRGQVLVGGKAAGQGTLTLTSRTGSVHAAIMTSVSPHGSRRQQTYGDSGSRKVAKVDSAGRFVLTGMRTGSWEVEWRPLSGGPSEPRQIEIPDVAEHEVTLDYPGGSVSGVVVDRDGRPVAGARAFDVASLVTVVAGPDGSFRLNSISEGPRAFRARLGNRESDIVRAVVERERETTIELILRDGDANQVQVRLFSADGSPASGAFVFVQATGQPLRTITADMTGGAVVRFSDALPTSLRVAAWHNGAWHFGNEVSMTSIREGLTVRLGNTGALVVKSERVSGRIDLVGPAGWNVAQLISQLGFQPQIVNGTLRIAGLSPGSYVVAAGDQRRDVNVVARKDTVVEFE
jgi:hypothetical protein